MKNIHHHVTWGACMLFALALRENTAQNAGAASSLARAPVAPTLRAPARLSTQRVSTPTGAVVRKPQFRPVAAQRAPERGYVLDRSGFSEGGRWAMLSNEANTTVFVASDNGLVRVVSATQFLTGGGSPTESFAFYRAPFAAQHTATEPLFDRSDRFTVGTSGDDLLCFDLEEHTFASLGHRPATLPIFSPDRERIAWRCESADDGDAVCVYHFETRRLRRVPIDHAPPALHWVCAANRQQCELTLTSFRQSVDEYSYTFWQGIETSPSVSSQRGPSSAVLLDADTGATEVYGVAGDSLRYLERSSNGRYVIARLSAGGIAVFERRKSAPFFVRTAPAHRWMWQSEGRAVAWTDEQTGRIEGDAQPRTRVSLHVAWLESGAQRSFAGPDGCADGTEMLSEFSGNSLRTSLECGGATSCFGSSPTTELRSYDAREGRLVRARPQPDGDAYCAQERAMRGWARSAANALPGPSRPSWVLLADNGDRGVVHRATELTAIESIRPRYASNRYFVVGALRGVSDGFAWSLLAGRHHHGWLGVHRNGAAIVWAASSTEPLWNSATR